MVFNTSRNGGAVMIGLNRRRTMGNSKPYDARIEYLGIDENTGFAGVDTGYNPQQSTTFILRSKIMLNGWVGSPSGYTPSILANAYSSSNQKATFWLRYSNDHSLGFYHARRHSVGGSIFHGIAYGTWQEIIHEHDKATVNGIAHSNNLADVAEPSSGNIILFGSEKTETVYGKTRFSYFQVEDEGMLKVDLIPVRIGNQGYMFDRVTNKLCRNVGTGNFILGPDK